MTLGIVALVVLILVAIALLPAKPRHSRVGPADTATLAAPVLNLRGQQLDEEASALAGEYRRLADEAWLAELRQKAAVALNPAPTATK